MGVRSVGSFFVNILVLHRLVKERPLTFEDVSIDLFDELLNIIEIKSSNIDDAMISDERNENLSQGICLTFDDGNMSDYEIACPKLLKKGAKATFFITTEKVNQNGFLSTSQIRELFHSGMQIGSHSMTHPNFSRLDARCIRQELTGSRKYLEDLIGSPITTFAFPFGLSSKVSIEEVFEAGYQYCCLSQHGVIFSPSKVLPRNSIHRFVTKDKLRRIVEAKWAIRMHWKCEDIGKAIVKTLFPRTYTKLRSSILEK